MSSPETPQHIYEQDYYKSHLGEIPYERNEHWLSFFGGIADNLIRSLHPARVFDAGCAWGFLVEALQDRGVDAWGRDISEYAIANVRQDMRPYCDAGSIAEPIEGRYDLITCIEVLEHMPEDEGRRAIHNMCAAADTILFSSSPSDFGEESHINVHSPLYWMKAFAAENFSPDIGYDASFVAPHAFLLRATEVPLPRDVLVLMSEKLRWRREWVAAHQAFVQASDRAIATDRQNEELTKNQHLAEELEWTLREWSTQNLELKREVLRSVEREGRSAILAARLREETAAQTSRTERAERERDELNLQLSFRDRELESIRSSPAWRLIGRYREWFERNRQKALIRNLIEPGFLLAFRVVGLGRPPAPAADPSPAPPEIIIEASPPPPEEAAAAPPPEPMPSPAPAPARDTWTYEDWIREFEPGAAELNLQRDIGDRFAYRPKISIVTPVYKVPVDVVRELIDSVKAQTYGNWELCIAHAWPRGKEVRDYLSAAAAEDSRIKLLLLDDNLGISGNSNRALVLVDGEYTALLDHDDTIPPFALYETVRALNERGPAELIYSDKDQLNSGPGKRVSPLFKPKWSPEIMLSANYLTHLTTMRTEVIRAIGGWRSSTDGAQDWDLFLRVIGESKRVVHIPKVLYHWRQIATSVAGGGMGAKPYAAEAQMRTLRDYFDARGWDADIVFKPDLRVRWKSPPNQKVSVILMASPGRTAASLAALAVEFSGQCQGYPIEVLFATDEVQETDGAATDGNNGIRAIPCSADAIPADSLNRLAAESTGDILIFVDENVKPLEPSWLDELTGPLQIAEVGIVGARLLDPTTLRIRHSGIAFNDAGEPDYIFSREPEHLFEEFGAAAWYRNWCAVSGACFSIRRATWESLGGFARAPVYPRLDIDLCLRLQFEAKRRILCNPLARFTQSTLAHIEFWMLPDKRPEYIQANFPDGDPNLSPNIVLKDGAIALRRREIPQPKVTDYLADSQVFVRSFDFSSAVIERSKKLCATPGTGEVRSLTWFIPEFTNPFYGGIHTILRFADYFLRTHGVVSRFAVLGRCHPSVIGDRMATAFPDLAARSDVRIAGTTESINALPECDGAIATLWTTAYALLHFEKPRRKFYFVQDYEPFFYPAGSASALVEATYDFGFHGICNTGQLRDLYTAKGGEADYFDPCIDPRVFHDHNRHEGNGIPAGGKVSTVFCYARPGHPRNGFELLGAALRIVKDKLGDSVRIVTAGADWDPATYDLQGVLLNLGNLGYATTGALYRACDVGLAMMMTCHPSYLPFELMACGSLVVTNRNPHTAWLLRDGENCLLAEGSATSLAERILEGLSDADLRTRITRTARELIANRYSDWDAQAEKIYQCLRRTS
jgi:glycosyltransferase involved in cell wall biosynthesis